MAFFPPNDAQSTGSITTQNLNPNSGTPTAGSFIALTSNLDGRTVASIQVTGTYTGALTAQGTIDNSNWINLAALVDQSTNAIVSTIASATVGLFQIDITGFTSFRISALAAVTGTAVVTIRGTYGQGIVTPDTTQNQDLFFTGQSAQTATVNNILTATSGSTAIDTLSQTTNVSYRSFSIQITSTGTGGTYIFEGSNDNSNFVTLNVQNITNSSGVIVSAVVTASAATIIYKGVIEFRYLRCRIASTITGGSIQAFTRLSVAPFASLTQQVAQTSAGNLNVTATVASISTSVTPGTAAANLGKAEDAASASGDTGIFVLGIRRDTPVASASANGDYQEITTNKWGSINTQNIFRSAKTFSAAGTVAIAPTPTDVFVLPGNATNTVFVTKVIVSGQATAANTLLVQLVRRSTALTGGTSSAMSLVAHDQTDTAVSAPLQFTANSTGGGSTVGTLRAQWLGYGSTTVPGGQIIWEFGDKGKELILSGVGALVCVNLNSTSVTGGNLSVTFEWVEI